MRTYQQTLLMLLVAGVPYAEADTLARELANV